MDVHALMFKAYQHWSLVAGTGRTSAVVDAMKEAHLMGGISMAYEKPIIIDGTYTSNTWTPADLHSGGTAFCRDLQGYSAIFNSIYCDRPLATVAATGHPSMESPLGQTSNSSGAHGTYSSQALLPPQKEESNSS